MIYDQPPLHPEQLADRLIKRGLIIENRSLAIHRLACVSYHRLSNYWHPYIDQEQDVFVAGTRFEEIWLRYEFDRELRLYVMDALERIEIGVLKTQLVQWFVMQYGPRGHLEPTNFDSRPKNQNQLAELNSKIENLLTSRDETIQKHREQYSSDNTLPLWIAAERLSIGNLVTFYKCLKLSDQKTIARQYGLFPDVFGSWIQVVQTIRNICAHHDRLWNRELGFKPALPSRDHFPEWYEPVAIQNNRVFAALSVFKFFLDRITPKNRWKDGLVALLCAYPCIPLHNMGIPEPWLESPLWQ